MAVCSEPSIDIVKQHMVNDMANLVRIGKAILTIDRLYLHLKSSFKVMQDVFYGCDAKQRALFKYLG